ncbi:MAG: class I SAM-dependent methyltransferase [Nitrososphaeria archaeon]
MVQEKLENKIMISCPICGIAQKEENYIETYFFNFNNQEYKLYHCQNCDLQWWEPRKILPEFYEKEGDEGYKARHLGIFEEIGENHKLFFKLMPIKSGKLLDVGCGDGVFLKEAKKFGFEVWGIDLDRKSIKVCQEKWKLKNTFAVTHEEFANFCHKERLKFDIITFFEVLEHQDKPKEFLETIKSMLKPNGYIVLSVPNRESLLNRKLYRELLYSTDNPPHHFLRFSKNTLENIFRKLGFEEILICQTPVKISDAILYLQMTITSPKVNKILRKTIVGSEIAGEGTTLYKESSIAIKITFKMLKEIRNMLLLLPALIIKVKTEGINLYFQGRLK